MDQGNNNNHNDPSMQHGDSNYNLYGTYGSEMDDDVNVVDSTTFPLGTWNPQYTDVGIDQAHYGTNTTTMQDIESTHYSHDYQSAQSVGHDGQPFHGFKGQQVLGDQHMGNQVFDLNSMDIYHQPAPSIYPNLTQEAAQYVDRLTPSSVSVHTSTPDNSLQTTEPNTASATSANTIRTNFKFSQEQKKILLEKFDEGLHYPTNAEKEQFAEMFGASAESISRWFERTRKEKGVQRTKKLPQDTKPQMPQYLPIQPQPQQHPSLSQSPNLIPQYGQFPSTYPYNTLNPQIFGNQQFIPSPSQPGTINPAAGLYAPIPFVGQHAQPGLQPTNSNTTTLNPPSPHPKFAVEIAAKPLIREDVYVDDTRDAKRPKLAPAPIAPKAPIAVPKSEKKPMSFEQEVLTVLRPSEWREDPVQAAEDLYDLMSDAEGNTSQKLFLLRSIRTHATEFAMKTMTSDENRRILAKIRNWFTAAIKANDKAMLSVILEVIKRMNLDGRTMAGIKLGKPLILLLKKDEPTLKAQVASLQKIAYEAYALEKDSGPKPTKQDTPLDAPKPVATPVGATIAAQQTSTSQPSTTSSTTKAPARPIIPADKAYSALASKIKVAKQPSSGSSFFGKLAQTPAIPKTPVVQKPIPLKKSTTTTPSQSMGMTAGGAVKPTTTSSKPPPKPTTQAPTPKPAAPSSKFSVLEYINRGTESSEPTTKSESETQTGNTSKIRKHVSWAAESELEQVKMIENITIQYADDLFWHPPQAIGSARDLDIGEGHAFGKDLVEYDVEEEIEWYDPKPLDFTALSDAEDRGVKRAGKKVAEAKDAQVQKVREAGVLLVTYLNDGDIPDSPSEPFLDELVSSQQIVPPKVIPFPQELRNAVGVGHGGGQQIPNTAIANPDVTAILSSLLAGSGQQPTYQAPVAPVQNPDLASILQTLSGVTAQPPPAPVSVPQTNMPANLDLTALLSQFQQPTPQPTQPTQRWTSPPPPPSRQRREGDRDNTRKGKKRETESRIKASRSDDVRESVRNSSAEQNMYRALCQFYKTGSCKVGEGCTFVHPRDMSMYDQ